MSYYVERGGYIYSVRVPGNYHNGHGRLSVGAFLNSNLSLTTSLCFVAFQLPGEQSMRMMNFILPLLKLSNRVRDALIDVLRKAMTK